MLANIGWTIEEWQTAYRSGNLNPTEALFALVDSMEAADPTWICIADRNQIQTQLNMLPMFQNGAIPPHLPLYGIPFVVKDNIDVAGFPTTAGCPAFTYTPKKDASAVYLLRRAGAIVIAKTNMDQFAVGLTGVHTPYGIPKNPFHKDYVAGTGSAVAVSRGIVPFSIDTDTEGTGCVPAGFNNIVGWKPTRGHVSTRGIVPTCRSLDCVSVFAMTVQDVRTIGNLIGVFDPMDPYSQKKPSHVPEFLPGSLLFAVPSEINWYGDTKAANAWDATLQCLQSWGALFSPMDFSPMDELSQMLYQTAWIAERNATMGDFVDEYSKEVDPTVAKIITQGKKFTAVDMCHAEYRRAELGLKIRNAIGGYTALLVPTVSRFPTVREALDEPFLINKQLGTYSYFVNLADACALACPGVPREDGLPFGITLIAPAWHEEALTQVGLRWEALFPWKLGAQ